MPNMANIISGHNNKIRGTTDFPTEEGCNCREGTDSCVLGGKCLTKGIVYKCQVTSEKTTGQESKEYVGLTATSFKARYSSHKASFKHEEKAHSTALSSHVWELKRKNIPHTLTWSILKMAPPYSKETQTCQLCIVEKTIISLANCTTSLNKRNEIIAKCRHRDKWLLKNW